MTTLAGALLAPRTVALIGASGNSKRLTARPQVFLQRHGFKGAVYPVNPGRDEVLGVQAYAQLSDIPVAIEHAYILLDTEAAIEALKDCAAVGVPVVSMLADGFADSGAEGIERQQHIEQIARDANITLIGPNSTGVVHTSSGFSCTTNAAFAADDLPAGRFAVLSQSGSMTGALLSRGAPAGIGFAAYVSTGNEAVAGVGEIGDALVEDPQIDGFVLFLETLRRPQSIARFAQRAHAAGKPILAYLVGRSTAGQALAVSHTGAMVGGTQAMLAFLRANAIRVVDSFEALIETSFAQCVQTRLTNRPRHATVVTTTGGGGGMVYDLIGLQGVTLRPPSDAALVELAAQGIDIKPGPLVDLTLAGTRYDVMKAVLKTLMADSQTGLIVAAIGSSAQFNPDLSVAPIVDAVAEASPTDAPIVAAPIPHAPQSIRMWNAGGVPAFRTPESCAQGVAALLAPSVMSIVANVSLSKQTKQCIENGSGQLSEVESATVLQSLGVPVPESVTLDVNGPVPAELSIPTPWVLKMVSESIAHKTERGGVQTGLQSRDELSDALSAMKERLGKRADVTGYLVQAQVSGVAELVVGLVRDPVVGPMISVGMGGVLTEIYQDMAMRPAPVNLDTANQMIAQVKGAVVLNGYRGKPMADTGALAEVIVAVSTLAAHERVLEAEINPLIVGVAGEGATAADALIRLKS
jgi:acyl-CoA synthetase (NDP forming)